MAAGSRLVLMNDGRVGFGATYLVLADRFDGLRAMHDCYLDSLRAGG